MIIIIYVDETKLFEDLSLSDDSSQFSTYRYNYINKIVFFESKIYNQTRSLNYSCSYKNFTVEFNSPFYIPIYYYKNSYSLKMFSTE